MAGISKEAVLDWCIRIIKTHVDTLKDPRVGVVQYSLPDILMAAFAVYQLKYASLLEYERKFRLDDGEHSNLRSMFQLTKIPSDTQLRDVLDDLLPEDLFPLFKKLFSFMQRAKLLERMEYMEVEGEVNYLVGVDGTGTYCSSKVKCEYCLEIEKEYDGKKRVQYMHKLLSATMCCPSERCTIPFHPEPILFRPNDNKQDGELTAFYRFIDRFKNDHPHLKCIMGLDALYCNIPVINKLKSHRLHFIITAKPDAKKSLFARFEKFKIEGKTSNKFLVSTSGEKIEKTTTRSYEWRNDVQFSYTVTESPQVNFLSFEERTTWLDSKGKPKEKIVRFNWITDIKITSENVEQIEIGGRQRWRIENDIFDVMKNHGYHLEHNYGHGKKHLAKNLMLLMFLSSLVDSMQEMMCTRYQIIKWKTETRANLIATIISYYQWHEVKSVTELYDGIISKYHYGRANKSQAPPAHLQQYL
ncbi:MAG: transposase [Minisyncoccia bacterium]